MLKHRPLMAVMATLLLLCACAKQKVELKPDVPVASRKIAVMSNLGVVAKGDFNLKIIADSRVHDLRFIAEEPQISLLHTRVDDNHMLHITLDKTENYLPQFRPTVILRTRRLHEFHYKGHGDIDVTGLHNELDKVSIDTVGKFRLHGRINLHQLALRGKGSGTIDRVNSHGLDVKMDGQMRVTIKGIADISKLDMSGKTYLNMHWVDSPHLTITARDEACIELAGIATRISARVYDKAQYDGKYLRAQNVFVRTYSHARADIQVVEQQHTFASGQSNIYFHSLPEVATDYMVKVGSVLNMIDITPNLEHYDTHFQLVTR